MPRPILKDYQRFAQKWLVDHPYCGLFMQVGTGKTLVVLDSLFKLNPKHHVLVIAPKNIARSTWVDEIKKWQLPLRNKSLLVDERGRDIPPAKRHQMYADTVSEPPTVYFINREKIPDLVDNLPILNGKRVWPFSIVVIDESQGFKNYASLRFKKLKEVRPVCDRVILLTGTPVPRDLMDLWSQIYLLDEGARLGKNITAYRNRWFVPGIIVDNHPVDWQPIPGAREQIYNAIGDIVISMSNKELNLPSLNIHDLCYHMVQKERDQYRELMKQYVLTLSDGTVIEASNSGVLYNKLAQMASGAIYKPLDPNVPARGKREFERIHEGKLELAAYIIDNTDDNVIIAYHYESDKEMLMEYFTKRGCPPVVLDGKPETIRAWNEKKIPIMLLQPASCGHGLNIQYGGHTLIWYTLTPTLEEYEQTIGRLHRTGQTEPVDVWRLLTSNTVDVRTTRILETKDETQSSLMQAVRAAIADADSDEY